MFKKLFFVSLLLFLCISCTRENKEIIIDNETEESNNVIKKGSIVYDGNELNKEQLGLINSYYSIYYEHISELSLCDFSDFFSNELNRKCNEISLELQVKIRQAMPIDYSLESYNYEFIITKVNKISENEYEIVGEENTSVKFKACDRESIKYDDTQYFGLEKISNKWLIKYHYINDGFAYYCFSDNWDNADYQEYIDEYPGYLAWILSEIEERENSKDKELIELEYENEYDRDKALEYSYKYINTRNEDFYAHDANCQNYCSQCLHAGGIPHDYHGYDLWKYHGDLLMETNDFLGRSASWTGVNEFIDYASNNTGFGLVALTRAPFFKGEKGDLIHMGTKFWRHSVIISGFVYDDYGNVYDYLINSNTRDLKDYPSVLYAYPKMILTKIYGYNN